jgi:hypothetical protein
MTRPLARGQQFGGQTLLNQPGEKFREGRDILANSGRFKGIHFGTAITDRYHRLRLPFLHNHRVHQGLSDPPVAIGDLSTLASHQEHTSS